MSKRTKLNKTYNEQVHHAIVHRCGFGRPTKYKTSEMVHTYLNALEMSPGELAKHKSEIVNKVEDDYKVAMIEYANDTPDWGFECQEVHHVRMYDRIVTPVMTALNEMLDEAYEDGEPIKDDLWHDIYLVMGRVLASAKTKTEYATALYGNRCGLVLENSERFKPNTKLGWQPKIKREGDFKTKIGEDLQHMAEVIGVKMFDNLIYNVGPKIWGDDEEV